MGRSATMLTLIAALTTLQVSAGRECTHDVGPPSWPPADGWFSASLELAIIVSVAAGLRWQGCALQYRLLAAPTLAGAQAWQNLPAPRRHPCNKIDPDVQAL